MPQNWEELSPPAWVLCPDCTTPGYGKRWADNLHVCPGCGSHGRIGARRRLVQLADPGTLELLPQPQFADDPLGFADTTPYPVRLRRARELTGLAEAVLCARMRVEGNRVVAVVMDFSFLGGSLGGATGELVALAAETALRERTPLLLVTASGGARMQEGAVSLMQMAKTSVVLARLDEAGLLTISLVTDPTFGGVAASFATATDVVLVEPGARLGFAGRRVIEQTIGEELPRHFQTAEFLAERGYVDRIVPRTRLRHELGALLRAGTAAAGGRPHGDRAAAAPCEHVVRDADRLPRTEPWEQVREARDPRRPTALDYFSLCFEDFQELHGDRLSGDCPAVVGGTAWLDDAPVVVVGHQKGHDPVELSGRNFGMATPAGYRKAARLMRLADKLGIPVITLVDTPGAFPGARAEEQGQAFAIAENLRLMASLRVPVVTVVIGEGGSGGALALALANRVLMLSGAVYSVISPEGCAAILWQDPSAAPQAARAMQLIAPDLLRLGVVDGVVPEPDSGVVAEPVLAADRVRGALGHALAELAELPPESLAADRRDRFRRQGFSSMIAAAG